MTASDPRAQIAEAPLSALQIGIIAVLFCLNGLDGFDVLTISFAAPGIVRQWAITPDGLGLVISIGLIATGFGSLVLAPVADRIGRRPIIAASLASMTLGMLICALAPTPLMLSLGRLFTGLGVGAVVPCISALAAEYANHRFRELAVVLVAIGFPAGGLLGGFLSAALLAHFDWRAVFAAGALTTGVLAIIAIAFVPESIEYLLARRPANVLLRLNIILGRLQRPVLQALPVADGRGTGTSVLDILARPELLGITLLVTLAYALHNGTTYYALNWIPKIVADLSLSQSQAAAVTVGYLAGAALLLWLFSRTPGQMPLLLSVAALLGAGLYGGQASLYGLMTRSFPVQVRATGVGFVTGAGRAGGIVAPIISGHLLGMGLGYPQVSLFMALGSLVGAIVLFTASRRVLQRAA